MTDTTVSARLRHIAGKSWGAKRYMNMSRLRDRPAAPKAQTQPA